MTLLYIWLADDNCVETFENTLDNNRRLLKQQDCPCDAEHMWSCPETDHNIKASDGSYADWMEQMNKPNSDLVRSIVILETWSFGANINIIKTGILNLLTLTFKIEKKNQHVYTDEHSSYYSSLLKQYVYHFINSGHGIPLDVHYICIVSLSHCFKLQLFSKKNSYISEAISCGSRPGKTVRELYSVYIFVRAVFCYCYVTGHI